MVSFKDALGSYGYNYELYLMILLKLLKSKIPQLKYTITFINSVVKKFLLISLSLFLISCERFYGLDNKTLSDFYDKNQTAFLYLSDVSKKYHIEGELNYKIKHCNNINGDFFDQSIKSKIYNNISIFLESIREYKSITFNLSRGNKNHSIFIELYTEGLCASFSNCVETYYVYIPDGEQVIGDNKHHYIKLDSNGWFLLKIK